MPPPGKQDPVVSFVIVTHQRPEELRRAINSVVAQNYRPIEIIVINNGDEVSTDLFSEIAGGAITTKLISLEENVGVSRGRNLGISKAAGDIVILLDDDAECADKNVVDHILSAFEGHPERAAIACRCIDNQGDLLSVANPKLVEDSIRQGFLKEVTCFVGVMAGLRKSAFDQLGYFPENYFYGAEEFDLSLRFMDAGFRIVYQPLAIVTHHLSPRGREGSSKGHLRFLNISANRSITAIYRFPTPYSFTQPLYWFCYSTWKTRFNLKICNQYLTRLIRAMKQVPSLRKPVSRSTLQYMRAHGEKLWY